MRTKKKTSKNRIMADKDNPNGTATTIGGTTNSGRATSRTVEIDNRLRFENGRIYISSIPYEGGRQSGFPEKMDVTEQVAKAIAEYIKPKEKPKYIIRFNAEFLERMYLQNCADTCEDKEKLFRRLVNMVRNFLEADVAATTVAYSFIDENGKQYKSWELVEVEDGDPLMAIVEDVHGNILRRMNLEEKHP